MDSFRMFTKNRWQFLSCSHPMAAPSRFSLRAGLNQAPPQTTLDKLVVQSAMGPSRLSLGDAIIKAKSSISDLAVRKTYNLLGDPVMQIKPPVATKKH